MWSENEQGPGEFCRLPTPVQVSLGLGEEEGGRKIGLVGGPAQGRLPVVAVLVVTRVSCPFYLLFLWLLYVSFYCKSGFVVKGRNKFHKDFRTLSTFLQLLWLQVYVRHPP